MKVLVIGSGGREHALAWKFSLDPRVDRVFAAPGSAGMSAVAECVAVGGEDIEGLANLVEEVGIDLTVVGPEAPLAAGVVDLFRERGLRIFGPDRAGARLEASKAFMKEILVSAGVPTAEYSEFGETEPARKFAAELGYPVVIKADGLAAGKGVVIAADADEARTAIESMLEGGRFGEAGSRIVVEEFLDGEEASFIALSDGKDVVPFAPSQDHKAAFDGDRGPNTGGMGAYSPAPVVTQAMEREIVEQVLRPTVGELRDRGIDFRGVLYAGLMITGGKIKVLEYNVRFGDPECQPLMVRLDCSLLDLVEACTDGDASTARAVWGDDAAACVVMASSGYPDAYDKGKVISGIDAATGLDGVEVFHAGTSRDADGRWVTAGGRVLGVTAKAPSIEEAVRLAYDATAKIEWDGVHYRNDIGYRAIGREKGQG
jgi:phosphoribosylamine--glycine ligase